MTAAAGPACSSVSSTTTRREAKTNPIAAPEPLRVQGGLNFILLLGVVVLVILSGVLHFETVIPIGDLGVLHIPALIRDGGQIVLAIISMVITVVILSAMRILGPTALAAGVTAAPMI